jgi:hypothetical protein
VVATELEAPDVLLVDSSVESDVEESGSPCEDVCSESHGLVEVLVSTLSVVEAGSLE